MQFTTLRVPGRDAVRVLNEYRSRFATTGEYPFLIGDDEERERLQERGEFEEDEPAETIRYSLQLDPIKWIEQRRKEAEEDGLSPDQALGHWPGEIADKGSILLHKDIVSGAIKPEVFLGLAKIEAPWHLPAVVKYGSWNECPEAAVHCAFHRKWQAEYGAEITGISGDVIECLVKSPPTDQRSALALAWQQYWYCTDIVEQGCQSVSNLAATLLHSPYWYFWWD